MRYLDLTLDLPPRLRHPMGEFLRSSPAIEREELLAWNLSAEEIEYALFYVEGEIEPYRRRIHEVEAIRDVTLTPIDDTSFYAYVCQETRPEDEAWRAAFAERSLVVVPPLEYSERGTRLVVVGESTDLRALLDDLPAGIDVTVEEVGDYDRRHATITSDLTDRQLAAVETAVALGYYDVPRSGTLSEVAAELDCSEATASTHLRKAERRVMSRIVGGGVARVGPTTAPPEAGGR